MKVFSKRKVAETGLSDFHRLISTFLSSQFGRLKPKRLKTHSDSVSVQTSDSVQIIRMKTMN